MTVARADDPPVGWDLLMQAETAMYAQHSVHTDFRGFARSGEVRHIVSDSGRAVGTQWVSFRRSGRAGHVTILVTAEAAFVRGDEWGLRSELGFRAAASKAQAGRWVRVPVTSSTFHAIWWDVTLQTLVDDLDIENPATRTVPEVVGGVRVRTVVGIARLVDPGPARVSVRAAAPHLPVVLREQNHPRTTWWVERFSRWNERLHVQAPANWVDLSKTGLAK